MVILLSKHSIQYIIIYNKIKKSICYKIQKILQYFLFKLFINKYINNKYALWLGISINSFIEIQKYIYP